MKTGVKEYWVVYPRYRTVVIHQFKEKKAVGMGSFEAEDDEIAESFIFPGLTVKLNEVFR
jgi:Uma2 family endonuclease